MAALSHVFCLSCSSVQVSVYSFLPNPNSCETNGARHHRRKKIGIKSEAGKQEITEKEKEKNVYWIAIVLIHTVFGFSKPLLTMFPLIVIAFIVYVIRVLITACKLNKHTDMLNCLEFPNPLTVLTHSVYTHAFCNYFPHLPSFCKYFKISSRITSRSSSWPPQD